jgi:hypothetical protein
LSRSREERRGPESFRRVDRARSPPFRVDHFGPWLADMSQLEDGSFTLPASPRLWPYRKRSGTTVSRARLFRRCCSLPAPLVMKDAIIAPSNRCRCVVRG